jgi:hypothetical protein
MKHLILFTFLVFLFTGCDKEEDDIPTPATECDVKGTYAGTVTASGGGSSPAVYSLRENNFTVGSVTIGGAATTFGGYRHTCDSVILSTWYNANTSYYLLKGAFSNNRTVISGTFQNLTTTSDFGTFTFTKQ